MKGRTNAGGGNSLQIPLDAPTSLTALAGNAKVSLTWTDPKDKYATPEGEQAQDPQQLVSKWAYTKIVRKVGGAPTGPNDGVLVLSSEVRNQYSAEPYEDTSVVNDTPYYYAAYAYTTSGIVSEGVYSSEVTPKHYAVYGVKIDLNDSDPDTSVTYTDDAEGLTPAYIEDETFRFVDSTWMSILKDICGIRPCVLKDGVVQYYLNPDNYAEKLDGGASNIGRGGDGDVMVEFDHCYINVHTNANYLYVQLSKGPVEGFEDFPFFDKDGVPQKHLYLSAYKAAVQNDKLVSCSGLSLTLVPYANHREQSYTTVKGEWYREMQYSDLFLIQILYLLVFKNLKSVSVIGAGNESRAGLCDAKGLFYGEKNADGTTMKLFGLEGFMGRTNATWLRQPYGWRDASRYLHIVNKRSPAVYDDIVVLNVKTGYVKQVYGDLNWGFIGRLEEPFGFGGSASTYFCDTQNLDRGGSSSYYSYATFGAVGGTGAAGIFRLDMDGGGQYATTEKYERLVYCGGEAYEE